jgi:hypothetical protein
MRMIYSGVAKNSEVQFFHRFRSATLPLPNPADFSQSRDRTRPACRVAASPRKAGFAQAKLACRARNVKNFHRLIFYGIVENSEVRVFMRMIYPGIAENSVVCVLSM